PENENLTMDLASLMGITASAHGILNLSDGTIAYIVRRFDRENSHKVAFEDFSQLLGLPSEEKYNVSVERMSSVIDLFSVAPGLDKIELFKLVLFNFLVGNSDAHTKNYGLLKYPHGYRLSPAYDLVNTHLIIPDDKDETALTINGKKRNLKRSDFDILAEYLKLSDKATISVYATLRKLQTEASAVIEDSSLPASLQKRYQDILFKNIEKIGGR
ncbi:MAG: HipA domain-containing protein, partial [Candidatus Margulisiibacteriota bacterium]